MRLIAVLAFFVAVLIVIVGTLAPVAFFGPWWSGVCAWLAFGAITWLWKRRLPSEPHLDFGDSTVLIAYGGLNYIRQVAKLTGLHNYI